MEKGRYIVRWPLAFLILVAVAGMFWIAQSRAGIDMDILSTLPRHDKVISEARYIFENHPVQDQIVIDLSHSGENMDLLAEGGDYVEKKLMESGLFSSTGIKEAQNLVPELINHIFTSMPVLFSKKDLERDVLPLLKPGAIRTKLKEHMFSLMTLDGIGLTNAMTKDPLGISGPVMTRLSHLVPFDKVIIYKGHLISSDRKHLLITAKPAGSGTDSDIARKLTALMTTIGQDMNRHFAVSGLHFNLVPVGSYRAALDNENAARSDTQNAVIFATLGIALLLIFAFPRPLMGLLALIPATVGTVMAFFVFSFLYEKISVMALGFGGAIISITVDCGIAYMLFLDRRVDTTGKEAAHELWTVGFLVSVTTVGGFAALYLTDFPILIQIGQFAALGSAFSFIFVHTLFPYVFPQIPAARGQGKNFLQRMVDRFALPGGGYKFYGAMLFMAVMVFFAKPDFSIDLSAMNTVSRETLEAEKLVSGVWGDIFNKVYLMYEGDSPRELQRKGDDLAGMLDDDLQSGVLNSAFVPSMIFPGEARARRNFRDWKEFWNQKRTREMRKNFSGASAELGFSPGAFTSFFNIIAAKDYRNTELPRELYPLLGISKMKNKNSWIQFTSLMPGSAYRAEGFYSRYTDRGVSRIFDPKFFSYRLGRLISTTFMNMILIVGISTAVLLFVFFIDITLTAVVLLPVVFAMVCTLGTMKIIGHPLDIPALMLSIVILGMGIDYAIFFVCSHQRYLDENHAHMSLIRMAAFLTGTSTIIGFGVLALARHSLLRSAGLTCFLGIGYSLLGAFAILPYLLNKIFRDPGWAAEAGVPSAGTLRSMVNRRFRRLDAYPRIFARIKMITDPMFAELSRHVKKTACFIDIGCGYGVPALWLINSCPGSRVIGFEPRNNRVRVAERVLADRGTVYESKAPDLPDVNAKADTVLMIDMIHNLSDGDFQKTLKWIKKHLARKGTLVIRSTVPADKNIPWMRWIETLRLRAARLSPVYRSCDEIEKILIDGGFTVLIREASGKKREEFWFVAGK